MPTPITPAKARKAAQLTPVELAAAVPCALSTVYAIEARGTWPRARTLRASYFRALGIVEVGGRITKAAPATSAAS